jgi:hypothetical protein
MESTVANAQGAAAFNKPLLITTFGDELHLEARKRAIASGGVWLHV